MTQNGNPRRPPKVFSVMLRRKSMVVASILWLLWATNAVNDLARGHGISGFTLAFGFGLALGTWVAWKNKTP